MSNSFKGGGVVSDAIDQLGKTVQKLWIFQLIAIFILVALMIALVAKERFTAPRGAYYAPGQMIYGDVPETIKSGDNEFDNPLYAEITRRWEPTSDKVNGYTVWKMK